MADITRGTELSTADYIDGEGGAVANVNLNDWLESATVSGIVHGDVAAANKDGADATPSMRTLVTDGSAVTAGKALGAADPRISLIDSSGNATANKIATSGTAVSVSSTAPSVGQILVATSASAAEWQSPGSGVEITGTGTISSSGTTITGVGTKATSELKVGDSIVANSEIRRVVSIASDTSWTIDQAPDTPWSGDSFTFIQSNNPRPWNVPSPKTSDFNPEVGSAGNIYRADASGGNIAVTLPAASALVGGNGYAFVKTSDDTNTLTLTCAGSDTFTDGTTSKVLTTVGSKVTIVSDGIGVWDIVSSRLLQGEIIQSARVESASRSTISAAYDPTGVASPTSSDGTEILTGSSALTMTPRSENTKLRVRGMVYGTLDNGGRYVTVAAFNGSTLLGAAGRQWGDGNSRLLGCLPFEFEVTSGQTTAITFALRAAVNNNSFYLNGINGGDNPAMNSQLKSWISVEEIAI